MDEFERKISQALRTDEAADYEKLSPEIPPWEMVFDTFKGRNRWLNALTGFWMIVFFIAAVICMVRFFSGDNVESMLRWGFGALLLMMGSSFLKLWWWLEMQKNAVIREVKRVELQLASLSRSVAQSASRDADA